MGYTIIIAILSIVCTALIVYQVMNRKYDTLEKELNDSIMEGKILKADLEATIANAQLAAKEIIDSLNTKTGLPDLLSPENPIEDNWTTVINLKNKGYSDKKIAEITNKSQGEVELISNLSKHKNIEKHKMST